MIEVAKFEETDCDRLISWIPDARFLLQWSGPQYVWPLDKKQICDNLAQTCGGSPTRYMFKAVDSATAEVVGHIELVFVDHEKKHGHIGRVLIGDPSHRGKGLGTELVSRLVAVSFEEIQLTALTLSVFDFNTAAVRCYRRLGFEQVESHATPRRFGDESWNAILMRLCKPEE